MSVDAQAPRLSADTPGGRAAAPVRIVHLGLGNFFRAHQAWYTEHAADADGWGIAAFTGRRPDIFEALAPQAGRFTLITKDAGGDRFETISALSAVHPATDHSAFLDYLARPEVVIVTSTVTEFGYARTADGHLDVDRVAGDLSALRADLTAAVSSVPAKLVAGLAARRAADAGSLTVLPCDNLAENGSAVRTVVDEFARLIDPSLGDWIADNIRFATCMVDRITPATTPDDVAAVTKARGYLDLSPVPTEPFTEWVISGEFVERPHWETAGAQFVDDVTAYEQRKLLLLNGAHSLLAYTGPLFGLSTVADAIGDARGRRFAKEWWEVACRHLTLPDEELAAYRSALLDRWANPRIRHLLAQIAMDGSQKLAVRVAPVVRAELAATGEVPAGAARPLAAWFLHLRGHGAPVTDAAKDRVVAAAAGDPGDALPRVLAIVGDDLTDERVVIAVRAEADALASAAELTI